MADSPTATPPALLRPGTLRGESDSWFDLHTRQAQALVEGRTFESGRPAIVGLSGFVRITAQILRSAAYDDPYAAWALLRIEAEDDRARAGFTASRREIRRLLKSLAEDGLTFPPLVSAAPTTIPMPFGNNHYAYRACAVLKSYDQLVLLLLSAQRYGIADREFVWRGLLGAGKAMRRYLCLPAAAWRYTGITRPEVRANSVAAQRVEAVYRELRLRTDLPPEVLDGTRRGRFAPPVRPPGNGPASASWRRTGVAMRTGNRGCEMNGPKPENESAVLNMEHRSSINEQYKELQRLIQESESKRRKQEKQHKVVHMPGAKAPPSGKKGRVNAPGPDAPSQLTLPQANHLVYVNPEPRIIVPVTDISPSQSEETGSESSMFLPGWHSECRGVPNGILRSALFAAIRPTHERRRIKNEVMASVDGLTVIYSGEQLDQGDLDVYEGELHFAMTHGIPLGKPVLHSDYVFLKSLGRGTGRKEYKRLRDSQLRMVGGIVQIRYGRYSYAGTLINDLYRDEKLKMTGPVFNPKLLTLFRDGSYSSVYWEHRLALSDSPLAQWLHGHYSSHKQPFDVSVR